MPGFQEPAATCQTHLVLLLADGQCPTALQLNPGHILQALLSCVLRLFFQSSTSLVSPFFKSVPSLCSTLILEFVQLACFRALDCPVLAATASNREKGRNSSDYHLWEELPPCSNACTNPPQPSSSPRYTTARVRGGTIIFLSSSCKEG